MSTYILPPMLWHAAGALAAAPAQRSAARISLAGGGALAAVLRGPWPAAAALAGSGGLAAVAVGSWRAAAKLAGSFGVDAFKVTDRFEVSCWDPQNPNPLSHDMATRPIRGLSWSGPTFGDE